MPRDHITHNHLVSRFVFATSLPKDITASFLLKVIKNTLEEINWDSQGIVSVAFVSKQKSRDINNKYAKNDYPTDVLSFSYPVRESTVTNRRAKDYSGEIIIASQIAAEQAKKYNVDFKSEIALLLVHGILHLSGLDHQDNDQKASFERLQSVILKSLNLMYHEMLW